MLLIGPLQSGKTTWIAKLIQNFSEINKASLKSILNFHALNDPEIFAELLSKMSTSLDPKENVPLISFVSITEPKTAIQKIEKELQTLQPVEENNTAQQLVIFNNLMFLLTNKASSTKFLNDLELKRCHHEKINVIFICQDLMYTSEKLRMLFSNSNYVVLFPNDSDKRNTKRVLRNRGLTGKTADNILKEAFMSWNYPYLILDNSQNCPENIRVRQGIFPDKNMYIYE